MTRRAHAIAGAIAFLTVLTFWIATLIAELWLSPAAILSVKRGILGGLVILIPAMVVAARSGTKLAGPRQGGPIGRKKKRMRLLVLNGLLVMAPSALFLYTRAAASNYDATFIAVQIVELSIGLVQMVLLALSFRDGLMLTSRIRPTKI
ncbi:hypothetical protein D3C72_1513970 [compost metagenome]